jgi:antitoxin (DNA-binding transcriptional repressor) of toxin-antitoxin stability system
MVMKTFPQSKTVLIAAGKFKATCLQLMDEVVAGKLNLTVTKRGKPVMFITAPPKQKPAKPRSFIGASKGTIAYHGDIVSALPNEWSAVEED